MSKAKAWTKEEEQYLVSNYEFGNMDVILAKLNRTASSISNRAGKLRLARDLSSRKTKGKSWTNCEIQFLKDNYASDKLNMLSKKFGIGKKLVLRKASKLGLKVDRSNASYNRLWTKDEERYLADNYTFGNIDAIADHLDRTRKAITERAKLLKLARDPETARKSGCKYTINDQFFFKWSEDMAYAFGMICADGNLSKSGNDVSICLHRDDEYLLYDISKVIGSDRPIKQSKHCKMSVLNICSKPIYEDLTKLGLGPCKSKTLSIPYVPDEFIPDFIRGVMDGDGSVDAKRKKMKIVSASKDFIYQLHDMFNKIDVYSAVRNDPYVWNGIKTDFYNLTVRRRKDVKAIYHKMYDNANLHMIRKKEAFLDMGIEADDFAVKCKSRMRSIVASSATGDMMEFGSLKAAKQVGYPRVSMALKDGKVYKGFTWQYASQ